MRKQYRYNRAADNDPHGTMADVAIAIWGKEAGGSMAAAHLVYVGCVGTQNQPKKH